MSVATRLRFDMRAPDHTPREIAGLYAACLEMSAWADARGFDGVSLSEHHGVADGFLPAPVPLATAIAACTERVRITISALLVTMYDPVKLAEDLVILDHVSQGRASVTAGVGYRAEEFAMFGVDRAERFRVFEETLEVMLRAWRGERFEWRGRTVHVTPPPYTEPHPPLMLGGQTATAARRAVRLGLPYQPANNDDDMNAAYRDECARHGHRPMLYPPGTGAMVWVAKDPDREWARIGAHLFHEASEYASWQPPGVASAMRSSARTPEELRAEGLYRILTPEECIAYGRETGSLILYPLCGGTPPEIAWEGLELFDAEVRPHLG